MLKTFSKLASAIVGENNNRPSNSGDDDHLVVAPAELIFGGSFASWACKTLTLTNGNARNRIAFRFAHPYRAHPAMGTILPGKSVVVEIQLVPRDYIDKRNCLTSNYKPEVVIEWLPIADAVVSSDGYEDAFVWTRYMVGVRSKTVKMLFKCKAIQVENKKSDVSTEMGGQDHLMADSNQLVQKLEKVLEEEKKLFPE